MNRKIRRIGGILFVTAALVFLLMQVIPPHSYTNPPVVNEPSWDSPETRALAKRACFDCHSNETVWPWYAYVAPVKWLILYDVKEGREAVNFSEWSKGDMGGKYAARLVLNGKMPLPQYLLMHPEARLTETEKERLAQGLEASMQ